MYAGFRFVYAGLSKILLEKFRAKTPNKGVKMKILKICTELGAFSEVGISEFEISLKFSVFLIPTLIFIRNFFLRFIILFSANFECKKLNLIFCQYLSFSVWFPLSLKHFEDPYYTYSTLCKPSERVPVIFLVLIFRTNIFQYVSFARRQLLYCKKIFRANQKSET